MTSMMTSTEKHAVKKVGKFYLKTLKMAGFFFLLGLILSGVAIVSSEPVVNQLELESGETAVLSQFFGEAGEDLQFTFGILEENGHEYNYENGEVYNDYTEQYSNNHVEDPWELVEYMEDMEWYIQVQLLYSENFGFDNPTVVKDVSGEINIVDMELYQDGFYKLKVTNQYSEVLSVGIMRAQVNMPLLVSAVVVWTLFAITIAFFVMAIHIGFWLAVIYIIIKALQIIQDDRRENHPNIIGPQVIGPQE